MGYNSVADNTGLPSFV